MIKITLGLLFAIALQTKANFFKSDYSTVLEFNMQKHIVYNSQITHFILKKMDIYNVIQISEDKFLTFADTAFNEKFKFLFGTNYTIQNIPIYQTYDGLEKYFDKNNSSKRGVFNGPTLGYQIGLLRKLNPNFTTGLICKFRNSSENKMKIVTEKLYFYTNYIVDSTFNTLYSTKSKARFISLEIPCQFDILIFKKKQSYLFFNIGLWGGINIYNSITAKITNEWSKKPSLEVFERNIPKIKNIDIKRYNSVNFGAITGLTLRKEKIEFRLQWNIQSLISKSNKTYDNYNFDFSILRPFHN
jgi:hypothetical protein